MKTKEVAAINHLKHLLTICNDGKIGYKHAAKNIQAGELKALFTTYAIQRAEFADRLKTCIRKMGNDAGNESGDIVGTLHRRWTDIKSALSINVDKIVIEDCLVGEKAAVEAYDRALEEIEFMPDIAQVLMQQRSQISEALHHLQRLEQQHAI